MSLQTSFKYIDLRRDSVDSKASLKDRLIKFGDSLELEQYSLLERSDIFVLELFAKEKDFEYRWSKNMCGAK